MERGAFSASLTAWRAKDRWPHMKLMHGSAVTYFSMTTYRSALGWICMRIGMACGWKGNSWRSRPNKAKRILLLMKAGSTFDGMSVGFRPIRTRKGSGAVNRYLVEVSLSEISLVNDPSNDLVRVAALSPADAAYDRLREAVSAVAGKATSSVDPLDKMRAALQRLA